MPYLPLKSQSRMAGASVTGTMPVRGENSIIFPQLLDTKFAKKCENYMIRNQGILEKRKGRVLYSDIGVTEPILMRKNYQDGLEVVAHGTTVSIYEPDTDTYIDLKTDFAGTSFHGSRHGDYFFFTNKTDGLYRISRQLSFTKSYDAAAATQIIVVTQPTAFSFTGGSTVILGGTSGATALVNSSYIDIPSINYWAISVTPVSGTFVDDETITISSGAGSITGTMRVRDFNPFGYSSAQFNESADRLSIGQIIIGETSGATATIVYDSCDLSATQSSGFFVVGNVMGTFQNGEKITGSVRGEATLTSDLTYTLDALSGNDAGEPPYAKVVESIGSRIFLGDLLNKPSTVAYSTIIGTNELPGEDFSTGSTVTKGGEVTHDNGGDVNSINQIGNIYFILQNAGWFAFTIDQIDLGGTLSKVDTPVAYRTDVNGYRGALMTPAGLIFASDGGIRRIVSIGQPNIPYTDQIQLLTSGISKDFFDDIDFSDCDIAYDSKQNYVLVTCAKNAGQSNLIFAIRLDPIGQETEASGAVGFITGWNISRFMPKNGLLYGGSSLDATTYELFSGDNDNGATVHTEYVQELNFGFPAQSFNLEEFYAWGTLTAASELTISFDRYDKTGYFTSRAQSNTWTKEHTYGSGSGYGESSYGGSGLGEGDFIVDVEDFTGGKINLRSNTRALVRFESNDEAAHTIHVFSMRAVIVTGARRRTLNS